MSLPWNQRKLRLAALLKTGGDDDDESIALDRLTHGKNVIGKTSKTMEIDSLRFGNKDLEVVGTLEVGQFGVIDLVTCRFNNCVYVRKSIQKIAALRTREQCSPQLERDLLLQALKTQSPWAPHLLCAFQTPTHLSLVMDYAEGGTLWDVLESSPHDGRILELDLRWWIPQAISAIHWCHSQGFVHRDIKPHNFVLTSDAHLLLIDFGSAAPLLPPNTDGSQLLPRQYCLIPCGTCDYISPEILQAHEEALVALEMEDGGNAHTTKSEGEYGLETDWWSLGAMIYEMAYGVAPFFASDIRSTYLRITNYERSLRFDRNVAISHELQHFLRRLLTHAKKRLGRHNIMEITEHPVFEGVDWGKLPTQIAPAGLHLPQFIYSEPKASSAAAPPISERSEDSHSQGFPFSAFFQSSSVSPGLSILRPSPGNSNQSHSSRSSGASFIGFSWGPTVDAFPEEISSANSLKTSLLSNRIFTPRTIARSPRHFHQTLAPTNHNTNLDVPLPLLPGQSHVPGESGGFTTPLKPYSISPHATLPRTSTIRRTAPRRGVSDREAMKQLVDCVGMSARKKVLESGRKPKILNFFSSKTKKGNTIKELRFDELARPIPGPNYTSSTSLKERSRSHSRTTSTASFSGLVIGDTQTSNLPDESGTNEEMLALSDTNADANAYSSAETTDSEGGVPPSPSPSPRPGSAMSTMSMTMFSRRSATPTSGFFGSTRRRTTSVSRLSATFHPLPGDGSVTVATPSTTIPTSSGFLKVPPMSNTENFNFVLENTELHHDGQQIDPEMYTNVNGVEIQNFAEDDWTASSQQLSHLEERHGEIMRDIRHLEHRLDQFLSLVEN